MLAGQQWQLCDGRVPHCTLPLAGSRLSLVASTSDAALDVSADPALALAKLIGFQVPCQTALRGAAHVAAVSSIGEWG